MIDRGPRSASVTALRNSKLSFVGRSAFETFGQSTPDLYRHITTLLARRLRDTNEALVATNFLSVKGRVARALLSLAEAFGRDIGQGRILIREKVSQSDLAAMAGIARENVSRALNDWANRSLVSRLAGYYCLENKAALNREAEGWAGVREETGRASHLRPRTVAAGLHLLSANVSGDISLATHHSLRE
jgi:CRP/FNR family cyclic AMP-dependent transcriptional regulator